MPRTDTTGFPAPDTLAVGLTLRFGVTGHRPPRLVPDQHDAIHAACRRLFAETNAILGEIHAGHAHAFSPSRPVARLVSALAAGADIVAAEAAVEEELYLSACMPFSPAQYSNDFAAADWAKVERLAAAAVGVMAFAEQKAGDAAAYEGVGRLVLAQSDILIAIWDGEPARGRGGTTEIVAEAIARHIPVIQINPEMPGEPVLLWSGLHHEIPDRPTLDGVERVPLHRALKPLIIALCAPPEGPELHFLKTFLGEDICRRRISLAWPLLMLVSGARSWRETSFNTPREASSADAFEFRIAPFTDLGRYGARLKGALTKRFARADTAANSAALQFRSSFVTNFGLAALAVLLALSSLLAPQAKVWLITGELLVIGLIIYNTRRAKRCKFHERWIDYRHLAERLRLLALSSTLGRLSLRDVEDGTTRPCWETWYARATAREFDAPCGDIDRFYLDKVRETALQLIEDQIAYHSMNAATMQHANERLHKVGDALFAGTILFCLIFLANKVMADGLIRIFGVGLTEIVTLVTAFFPALAAALYGIRTQGDFAANAERSHTISRRLKKLQSSLRKDRLTYQILVDRVRRLSEIMLSEMHQWQEQYETRPLSLPG